MDAALLAVLHGMWGCRAPSKIVVYQEAQFIAPRTRRKWDRLAARTRRRRVACTAVTVDTAAARQDKHTPNLAMTGEE